jgi:hypothetical protein
MLRSPTAIYIVIQSRGSWWVDFEGKAHGPYKSREEAAVEAGDLAKFSAHAGRRSQVQIPDDDGRYRVAWQSGTDDVAALPSRPEVVQLARKLAPRLGSSVRSPTAVRAAPPSTMPGPAAEAARAGQVV